MGLWKADAYCKLSTQRLFKAENYVFRCWEAFNGRTLIRAELLFKS